MWLGQTLDAECRCVFENREGWVEVVRDLATMYHKRRNFAKARKAFSSYLASVDSVTVGKDTLSMVGLAATAMGDIDEGLRHYNAAIRKDPEFKEAWLNMFQGLKECGRVRIPWLMLQVLGGLFVVCMALLLI